MLSPFLCQIGGLLCNLESVVLLIQALEKKLIWEYGEVLQAEALAGIQTKCSAR